MQRPAFRIFLFPFFLLFVLGCKKDKADKTTPVIDVILPAPGTTFHMFDTIRLSASLHDETKLQRLEITIRDQGGAPVQNGLQLDLSGTDHTLNDWIELYEFRMPTGDYNIEFTLTDGSNTSVKNIPVHIIESPVQKKGYYFVSEAGSNHSYLRTDTNYTQTGSINHSGAFEGCDISNYYQQLYAASGINQQFRTYNMTSGIVKWTLNNSGSGANITACVSDGKNVFLGKYDGNVYKYSADGNIVRSYSSSESNYYVKNVFTTDNYVIATLCDFGNTNKKVVVFENSSGIVRKVLLNTDAKAVFQKSANELYVFCNDASAHAVLELLTLPGGSVVPRFDFGAFQAYSACMIDSNTLLFSTSEGKIWYFQNSSTNAVPVLNTVQAKQMKIDNRVRELYVASDKNFYVYNVAPFVLSQKSTSTQADTIADFVVVFNK